MEPGQHQNGAPALCLQLVAGGGGSQTRASTACWTHPTPRVPKPPSNAGWRRPCSRPGKTQRPLLENREHQKSSKTHRPAAVGARALGVHPPLACVCLSLAHLHRLGARSFRELRASSGHPGLSWAQPAAQDHTGPQLSWLVQVRLLFCFVFLFFFFTFYLE